MLASTSEVSIRHPRMSCRVPTLLDSHLLASATVILARFANDQAGVPGTTMSGDNGPFAKLPLRGPGHANDQGRAFGRDHSCLPGKSPGIQRWASAAGKASRSAALG